MSEYGGGEVRMGNVDAREGRRIYKGAKDDEGELVYRHLPGKRVCYIGCRGESLADDFRTITDPSHGVWVNQSFAPPAWVAGSSEALVKMLAAFYGCPVGMPEGKEWIR